MRYVGGYLDYLALRENAADYEDVRLVLIAEGEAADAARRDAEAQAAAGRLSRGRR